MKTAWFLADPNKDPAQLPAEGWRQVALPHQWTLDPELAGRQPEIEAGWYRLELPPALGRRWAEVRADYFCEAWIANRLRLAHTGYFEPFWVEVPAGENLLLCVSAPKEPYGEVWPRFKRQIKGVFGQHDCRPGGVSPRGQERGTGGLWCGVRYFRTGPVALLHAAPTLVKTASGWTLWLELLVDAAPVAPTEAVLRPELPAGSTDRCCEVFSLALTPKNFAGETLASEHTLDLTSGRHRYTLAWELPELPRWEVWERGFPHLYDLAVGLKSDGSPDAAFHTQVGFRTLAEQDGWLVLNEQPLFLRGSNIIPTQWLAGYNEAGAQRDVRLAREAHLNALRVHAHLTHPCFYDACDAQGMLVWQDFPLQWGYAEDEAFSAEAARQVQAMPRHFGNHPCIYQWCAHNEPSHNRHTLDPLLAAALRQADATRPVKEASDFHEHPYCGWYTGSLRDFLATPGGPLPSEFGAQALPRLDLMQQMLGSPAWPIDLAAWAYHNYQPDQTLRVANILPGDSLEDFIARSQAYQARLIRFAVEAYRRGKGAPAGGGPATSDLAHSGITGYFQFMFVDPWEAITWSVLDVDREPKLGYFALQEASTPVLLSLIAGRAVQEIGQPPLDQAWVINDLLRPLEARLALRLEGPGGETLQEFTLLPRLHIAAQSSACVFRFGDLFEFAQPPAGLAALAGLSAHLAPGVYQLAGELYEGDTLLARSELSIAYVEPILQNGAPL